MGLRHEKSAPEEAEKVLFAVIPAKSLVALNQLAVNGFDCGDGLLIQCVVLIELNFNDVSQEDVAVGVDWV